MAHLRSNCPPPPFPYRSHITRLTFLSAALKRLSWAISVIPLIDTINDSHLVLGVVKEKVLLCVPILPLKAHRLLLTRLN